MKAMLIVGILVLSALPVSAPGARAQDEGAKKQKVVKVGKTVYDFEDVDISARLKKPEGQAIVEAPEFRFRRLLDLDESFIPNIVRSVDEF